MIFPVRTFFSSDISLEIFSAINAAVQLKIPLRVSLQFLFQEIVAEIFPGVDVKFHPIIPLEESSIKE